MSKLVKYDVCLGSVEFKTANLTADEIIDLYFAQQVTDTELLGSFTNLHDAKGAFNVFKSKCSTYSFARGWSVAYILFLDENVYIYDEDEEDWLVDQFNGSVLVHVETPVSDDEDDE